MAETGNTSIETTAAETMPSEFNVPLSELPKEGFGTSFFGFRKDEVLNYIEKISAENLLQQRSFIQQITTLEERIAEKEAEKNEIIEKTKEVKEFLLTEQEKSRQITQQNERVINEMRSMQERMTKKEQELATTRSDKFKLERRVAELEADLAKVHHRENEVGAVIIEAQRTANEIVEKAEQTARGYHTEMSESARDIGATVARLKEELSKTEQRIDVAFHAMKDATIEIERAVAQVDKQVVGLASKNKTVPPSKLADNSQMQTPPASEAEVRKTYQEYKERVHEKQPPSFEESAANMAQKMRPAFEKLQEKVLDSINKLLSGN